MKFNLNIWRQASPNTHGYFETIEAKDIPPEASFLEMLDIVNEQLTKEGNPPIAFDSDCREGICGTCSLTINGIPQGPKKSTVCQLYMRNFDDGDTIFVEPFRVNSFPILRDLIVDRSSYDRIIRSGGFITQRAGAAPDANDTPIPKPIVDYSMDAAACIGCGACAAACPNGSAMLFVAAKVTHLNLLPQGKPESNRRVSRMVAQMNKEGFGNCSNYYECEAVCPANMPVSVIARMNREYALAKTIETVS
jgi:succinate dehydrogenase / fumarate reductase iron-sulfur subunit